MEKRVVIITGDSDGLGAALVKLFERDSIVYGISRREIAQQGNHFQADVQDADRLCEITKEIYDRHRHIDIIVCCAGIGVSGAVELLSNQDIDTQMNINFGGVVNANRAVIPYMRKQGFGRIVNISSVAAIAPIPFQSIYSASKAAVNAYSMSLANELYQFGIKVISIMPGDIHTSFTGSRKKADDTENLYNGLVSTSIAIMEHDEMNGPTADEIALKVYRCINRENPKLFYVLGASYRFITFFIKHCTSDLTNRFIRKVYLKKK